MKKEVVKKEESSIVSLEELDSDKIYVTVFNNVVYHALFGGNGYSFRPLNRCKTNLNGTFDSPKNLILHTLNTGKVYQLDNQLELADFIKENINK